MRDSNGGEGKRSRKPFASTRLQIKQLERERKACVDADRRKVIAQELKRLRRIEADKTKPQPRPTKVHVPIPQSYISALAEKAEAARKISGRDRLRVRFVQGGSPGAGRRS